MHRHRRQPARVLGALALVLGAGVLAIDWWLVRATKDATRATWESGWLAGLGGWGEGLGAFLETGYHGALLCAGTGLVLLVAMVGGFATAMHAGRGVDRTTTGGAVLAVAGLLWIMIHL